MRRLRNKKNKRLAPLLRSFTLSISMCVATTSCMLMDASKQQALMKELCGLKGTASGVKPQGETIVVVLIRKSDPNADNGVSLEPWHVVDHYVVREATSWRFAVPAGTYRIAAFDDVNSNLVYEPGESFVGADPERTFECISGEQWQAVALSVPASPAKRFDKALDVASLQSEAPAEQADKTLGQLTAVGEIVTLSDPRFSLANAENSLWRPYDFIVESHPGVYFLEPYDPKKIPVLFVHGINGSPLNFEYLIQHLDRTRFQPWMYSYPSGIYLSSIADHLTQTMVKLETRYDVTRFATVAHSMGGLVARGFLLRHAKSSRAQTPLFVTMSTPWAGHEAAQMGVKHAPVVVDVWRDMVPGSDYIKSLFTQPLPDGIHHQLIFTFERNSKSFGASGDHTVTVASQLSPPAQQQATRVYGFDATHDGVLSSQDASNLLNGFLQSAY
jgi:Alpha/beta hydrolase of unknown function (DUF915)